MNLWPSVWCSKYFFFHNFLQDSLQKSFQFIKLYRNENKEFWVPQVYKKLWVKKILGMSRRFVDESFVPSAQGTSILYYRLSDFCFMQLLTNLFSVVTRLLCFRIFVWQFENERKTLIWIMFTYHAVSFIWDRPIFKVGWVLWC